MHSAVFFGAPRYAVGEVPSNQHRHAGAGVGYEGGALRQRADRLEGGTRARLNGSIAPEVIPEVEQRIAPGIIA
jgi:hypothetical protein